MSFSSFIRAFFLGILVVAILPVFADGENQLTQFPLKFIPYSAALHDSSVYIHNNQNASVSILDPIKSTIEKTIPVESGPVFSIKAGDYVYVLNSETNTVSVIDNKTFLLKKTLTVSSGPKYAALV